MDNINDMEFDKIEKYGDDLVKNLSNNFLKKVSADIERTKKENDFTNRIEPNYLRGYIDKSKSNDETISKNNDRDINEDKKDNNLKITNKPLSKVEKLLKKYNNEYTNNMKGIEKTLKKEGDIMEQFEKYTKEINSIKSNNRDEDLLKIQKENQEIEMVLNQLKNQDKSELIAKEEESRKLVEELNTLFELKKAEALEKDRERKAAIEEIKMIRSKQENLKKSNEKAEETLQQLEEEVKLLEKQVQNYENYKRFIDEVVGNSDNNTVSGLNYGNKEDYDKLKEKFENLIERMNEIKDDISKLEKEIEDKKKEKSELKKKNDRQSQNHKVSELEEEAKILTKENELLEREIEEIMKKNQKKESDNHRIMLSIINLYKKVAKKERQEFFDTEKLDEDKLCIMLNEIGDNLNDYIAIYMELEGQTVNSK